MDFCASTKATKFFLAYEPNPATQINITAAMKCRGYSEVEAAYRTLQMQVHHAVDRFKGEDTPHPPDTSAMDITALLALGSTAILTEHGRGVLSATIFIPMAAAFIVSKK